MSKETYRIIMAFLFLLLVILGGIALTFLVCAGGIGGRP